jgi:hypothetical protein
LRLHQSNGAPAFLQGRFAYQVVLGVLREPDRDHRTVQNGGPESIKCVQSLLQHRAVVHPRRQHDLSVEFDAVLRKAAQLRNDVGCGWIAQQIPADGWVRGVDRNVQRGEPVFDDSLDIAGFEVGKSGEVAVPERQPIVVIADVEHVSEPVRQAVDKAEITAVGAAADAGRLEGNP